MDRSLIKQRTTESKPIGYINVQTEQYGFDEEVNIMIMPNNKFIDYVDGSTEQ